ncbi:hypothetical protein [Actinomyces trachealis]|uniref:hypothetical protein n=1 Tax=Actinomyces trachealis TaxID=2763540 RepID=UPI0018C73BD5|nr:hypothetical protein [Actinomyces trachealis]
MVDRQPVLNTEGKGDVFVRSHTDEVAPCSQVDGRASMEGAVRLRKVNITRIKHRLRRSHNAVFIDLPRPRGVVQLEVEDEFSVRRDVDIVVVNIKPA